MNDLPPDIQIAAQFFLTCRPLSETAYAVTVSDNLPEWPYVCRLVSTLLGGQWWPNKPRITWLTGRRATYFIDESEVAGLMQARAITAKLTGEEPGWSTGSCARAILKTVGERDVRDDSARAVLRDLPYAYHQCYPQSLPSAAIYDVQSCYYNLLKMLPGPRVYYAGHRFRFCHSSDAETERWQTILAAVGECKPLRNALIGCMIGGTDRRQMFYRGEQKSIRAAPGPFRPAGLAVTRVACELCMIASLQARAAYAMCDSVIATEPPTVWGDFGLTTRRVADGETDIRARNVYKCGWKATDYYKRGQGGLECSPTLPPPAYWHHRDYRRLAA